MVLLLGILVEGCYLVWRILTFWCCSSNIWRSWFRRVCCGL